MSKIITNPNQPRKHFNEESLNELANSILNDGLQEAILVRPHGDKYEIVQGERRYRANKLAGLETIQVKIKDMNDEDAFHLSVIENIQREDMTAIEEAHAFLKYTELGMTHQQIANKVSKTRDYVTSKIRLLKLSELLQEWLVIGKILDGHAKQILKMESIFTRLLEPTKGINGTDNAFEFVQKKFINEFSDKDKISVREIKDWVEEVKYILIDIGMELILSIANEKKYKDELKAYTDHEKISRNYRDLLENNSKMKVFCASIMLAYGFLFCNLTMVDIDDHFQFILSRKSDNIKTWEIHRANEEWKGLFNKYNFEEDIEILTDEINKHDGHSFKTFNIL
jgi:ParB/RepB/Spo0J family partition protein